MQSIDTLLTMCGVKEKNVKNNNNCGHAWWFLCSENNYCWCKSSCVLQFKSGYVQQLTWYIGLSQSLSSFGSAKIDPCGSTPII